jgi:arabinofuranan 3-O-arabinosyltransferase
VRGTQIRLVVDEITPRTTPGGDPGDAPLPLAVAEIDGTGMPVAPTSGQLDTRCRADLVALDGRAVPIRTSGRGGQGALTIEACDDVELGSGTHRLRSSVGEETGLDLDGVTLRSREDGEAAADARPADPPAVDAELVRATAGRTSVHADLDAGDDPFWFVLGQSRSSGWDVSVDGGSAGPRTLVDGYANGWLITPDASGRVAVTLTWTPQRQVWLAMGVSALAIVLSALILLRTARTGPPPPAPQPHLLGWRESTPSGWRTAAASGLLAGIGVAVVSRWRIGLLAGAATVLLSRWPVAAWGVAGLASLTLLSARVTERPELGWLALGWVVAAVVADLLRPRGAASG